jgi:hypothetical protein
MKRAALTAITMGMVLLTIGVSPTWAQPTTTICVPEKAGTPVVSGTSEGTCTSSKDQAVRLPGPEGLATLNKILPHLKFQEEGVGGKPTIQVTGANVQIINGMGHSDTTNGAGNLVIGYDESCDVEPIPEPECKPPAPPVNPKLQTGSHNIVVGDIHTYTSWGSIIGGKGGKANGPGAIMGGVGNRATANTEDAFLVGAANEVFNSFAGSVSGGERNRVNRADASVSGGVGNTASGIYSSVTGGERNKALGFEASVSGGVENTARAGTIVGGDENEVAERGERAAILGGRFNVASGEESAVLGGQSNKASGDESSVSGGQFNTAGGKYSSIGGGWNNEVRFKPFTPGEEGMWAAIFGGKENITAKDYDAIP